MAVRKRWIGLALICFGFMGLQACQPSYKAQEDCGYVQNVYGQRISWKGQTPILLSVHQSFPANLYPALEGAIRHWEQAAGKPLFQIAQYGLQGPLTPRQDGINVIYFMNTWEADKASEQARTSVYWVGDTIREADIRVNAKNFTFYLDQPATNSDVHMESLLVHELGHILGLKHRDGVGSVMATYLSSLTNRSVVAVTDVKSLQCEY